MTCKSHYSQFLSIIMLINLHSCTDSCMSIKNLLCEFTHVFVTLHLKIPFILLQMSSYKWQHLLQIQINFNGILSQCNHWKIHKNSFSLIHRIAVEYSSISNGPLQCKTENILSRTFHVISFCHFLNFCLPVRKKK